MSELQKGDRVVVSVPGAPVRNGLIIGTSFKHDAWWVKFDVLKTPILIRKRACQPAPPPATPS